MAQHALRHWWGLLMVVGLRVPFLVQCVATAVPVSHPTGAVVLCKHGCAPPSGRLRRLSPCLHLPSACHLDGHSSAWSTREPSPRFPW